MAVSVGHPNTLQKHQPSTHSVYQWWQSPGQRKERGRGGDWEWGWQCRGGMCWGEVEGPGAMGASVQTSWQPATRAQPTVSSLAMLESRERGEGPYYRAKWEDQRQPDHPPRRQGRCPDTSGPATVQHSIKAASKCALSFRTCFTKAYTQAKQWVGAALGFLQAPLHHHRIPL